MPDRQEPARITTPTAQAIELVGKHWGLGLAVFLFVVAIVGAQAWYIKFLTDLAIRENAEYRETMKDWRGKADAAAVLIGAKLDDMGTKLDKLLDRSERK